MKRRIGAHDQQIQAVFQAIRQLMPTREWETALEAKRREREEKREQRRMHEVSRNLDALAKRLGR